ncbi:MAG: glycerophosphodiester phosphodiesterase family protein, partial [Myxococcota bacterium]|nr:glycerophosphodiester phosphodiesterase family protein [Myxococcota bacterium]
MGFDLQGHRGARGLAPENTLEGFTVAAAIGVHTLELDVGMSGDGVVVVCHDRALRGDTTRGPGGTWLEQGPLLRSMTVAEIRRYDVGGIQPGTRYAQRFPEQVPVSGARVPTLAEVLDWAGPNGEPPLRLNIELKTDPHHPGETVPPSELADAVLTEVRAAGLVDR